MSTPAKTACRKKVLICYTELLHYRIPLLEALALDYDLTVAHGGTRLSDGEAGFNEIVLPARKLGRFRFQSGLLRLVRSGHFSAEIFFLDVAWVSILLSFVFCPRGCRRVSWGLWRTRRPLANVVRLWAARFASANVFYSDVAAAEFAGLGIPKEKIWVARNTVRVTRPERVEGTDRNTLIFIGSFDPRKQNDVAVKAFHEALEFIPLDVRLVFVGDGVAKKETRELARDLPESDRIKFCSGTIDPETIRRYYSTAIASVSYGQAGLSVLQSLGHGVPFITRRDAISGGEIENLTDDFNSILCESDVDSLRNAFIRVCTDRKLAERLGRNAIKYYKDHCTIECMASGFIGAVEGADPPPRKSLGNG